MRGRDRNIEWNECLQLDEPKGARTAIPLS